MIVCNISIIHNLCIRVLIYSPLSLNGPEKNDQIGMDALVEIVPLIKHGLIHIDVLHMIICLRSFWLYNVLS